MKSGKYWMLICDHLPGNNGLGKYPNHLMEKKEKIILLTTTYGFAMLKTPHIIKNYVDKIGMLMY